MRSNSTLAVWLKARALQQQHHTAALKKEKKISKNTFFFFFLFSLSPSTSTSKIRTPNSIERV
jgi:hypothetical protein